MGQPLKKLDNPHASDQCSRLKSKFGNHVAQVNAKEMAMNDTNNNNTGGVPEVAKPAASAATFGAIGYGTVSIGGMTAVGMVGGGVGTGMAAGPVGAVMGGLVGLALYGAYRAVKGK